MSSPQFVDELPERRLPGHPSQYGDFIQALRDNPGRWAIAPQEKSANARSWARGNQLEVTTRQGVTYVRVSPSP